MFTWLHVCMHVPPPVSVHMCICACALCMCACECAGEQNKVLSEQKLRAAPTGVGRQWSVRSQERGVEGRTPGSQWDWKGAELSSGLHAVSDSGSWEAGSQAKSRPCSRNLSDLL